ncbi:MAG: F0F1 ATP synthase subunit B [Acidimicrobiales bacterium]
MIATSNFLVPNGTFIVELIAFVIVLGVVGRYALPPLNKMVEARREQIRSELEAAERARSEATAADEERQATLDEARRRAREILEAANRAAESARAEAAEKGREEHDRIIQDATAELDHARQRALDEATAQIGELVMEVVERIIAREMDTEVHRDLLDEAIAALKGEESSEAGV